MASSSAASDLTAHKHHNKPSYTEAVKALNSLQSNAETIKRSLEHRNESRKHNIARMVDYLQRAGLTVEDIDKLNVIHVTGTKGKGSTCAFAESILRQYGYKTGTFSSPHLIEVRERIRINGHPIDQELFSTAFWDVYNRLKSTEDRGEGGMPHYFGFLTVMAFHVFVREGVDVVLLEVGIGGQYDSTNVVSSPVVCGISSLDLDHTSLLGHTLEEIAWHKAGIFKKGAPAVTVEQPDSAMQVLLERSQEIQCPLYLAPPLMLEELCSKQADLGIAGPKQLYNAALAVQLCTIWLSAQHKGGQTEDEQHGCASSLDSIPVRHSTGLSQQMITGLCECRWPGRTQTVHAEGVTYYLDGAHTTDSMQQCVQWFQQAAEKERTGLRCKVSRALVFNMTGDRPVSALLNSLKVCEFQRAAFCPNVVSTIASENIPDQMNLTVEQDTVVRKCARNQQSWDKLFSDSSAKEFQSHPVAASMTDAPPGCGEDVYLDSVDFTRNSDDHVVSRLGDTCDLVSPQECESKLFPCISSALQWATQRGEVAVARPKESAAAVGHRHEQSRSGHTHVQVLVTGSLHLVGGVLELISPHMNN
ncbi:hypothetical protein V1264_006266 [Littorina saxatilis]